MKRFSEEKHELVQKYLNKTTKIKGLYVLNVGELTFEDMHNLMDAWRDFEKEGYVDAPLVVVPNDSMLTYENRFGFERAMQIVRAGGQVRRLIWNPKHYVYSDSVEILLDDETTTDEGFHFPYIITQDDLEAIDWIVYEEIE